MLYDITYYFLLYFMYCILGYILECAYCSIVNKKIVLNRGFLIGPYLPIYGTGAMIIIVLLKRYMKDPIVLFFMAAIICTTLEYFTSYVMEKVFKARWWDYSTKKYNINGRVCLENSMLFGIGSLFIMYIINPYFEGLLFEVTNIAVIGFGIFFILIYLIDTIISIGIIYKISKTSVFIKKDVTDQINEKVQALLKHNFNLKLRLLNAFPDIREYDLYKKVNEIINKK